MDYSEDYPATIGELVEFLNVFNPDTPLRIMRDDGAWVMIEVFYEDGTVYFA